jgi:peroxiredoxin
MVVHDGIIEAWFEEPGINDDGFDEDPYSVSSPETVLEWLRGR